MLERFPGEDVTEDAPADNSAAADRATEP